MTGRAALVGVALLLVGCAHTEPFAATPSGAVGPFTSGPEAQLTVNGVTDFSWTSDARGILITTGRPNELYDRPLQANGQRRDPLDTCLAMLPAGGGSATWQLCDRRYSHFRDSTDVFSSAAAGPNNQLLYVEFIGRPGFFFPAGHEAELWLTRVGAPFADRRHLLTLYRDNNGHPTVPTTAINWITDLAWTGASTFLALVHYLRPDSFINTFGIAVGTITRDTTRVAVIPGTQGVPLYSPAEDGATVVFLRPGLTIMSADAATGVSRLVAVLPQALGRVVLGLSCQRAVCVIVTGEPPENGVPVSKLWRVSLGSGQTDLLRTYADPTAPDAARLAPDDNRVVMRRGGRLFLVTDLAL